MWSRSVIILFLAVSALVINNRCKWNDGMFGYDPWGYYLYLPATFIYHDPGELKFIPELNDRYHFPGCDTATIYGHHLFSNGKRLNKYPSGVAIAELPLFLAAHAWCSLTGYYPADGYSKPYVLSVILTYPLLALFGLLLLRRLLKAWYKDGVVAIALLGITFATNLYNYVAFDQGFSHPLSFTLFAGMLYVTQQWYATEARRYLYIAGILCGWIIITRPINMAILILPLLWAVSDRQSLNERLRHLRTHRKPLAAAALLCTLMCGIQLAYWLYITGSPFVYSYKGEHFDFLHPKIWKGLFSFRKGWFVYTPIAFTGLVGLLALWKTHRKLVPALLLYFGTMIYVVFSWKMWWYGGSFGCRPLIEVLAVLALPLAAAVDYVRQKKNKLLTSASIILLSFFITLNMFQTYQYSLLLIHWDRMTFKAWCKSFGKIQLDYVDYDENYLMGGKEYWDDMAEVSKE